MNRLLIPVIALLLLPACKKAKEKAAEDIIIKAMTDGQWMITSFINNGADITSDYTSYKFKYYSNYTVDAIKNGSVEKTGTWEGDAVNLTISASFSGAVYPINLINGTWQITDNSWTYVEAKKVEGADIKTLRLDKL